MKKIGLLILFLLLLGALPTHAKTELDLPRFVSLKPDEVNIRTGPGLRYQIKWVIHRQNLPLEVIAEFEQWRKVRDMEGEEGWTHSAMLSSKRMAVLITPQEVMRQEAAADADPVAKIEKGAIAELVECTKDFCRLHTGKYKGWVPRASVWGVYPEEWTE